MSSAGILVSDKYGHIQRPRPHHGASDYIKDLRGWSPGLRSADGDLLNDLPALTARSRDLHRNNGIASAFPQTYVDNVIGPKLRLSATPNWRVIGRDEEWAEEWQANVEAHWRPYANSSNFDLAMLHNFHTMAAMVLRGKLENGGALVIVRWRPGRPGARYGTCFQLVEIDRLCNPDGKPDTDRLRGGIEFNRWGAPIAYHIRSRHPGDYTGLWDGPHRWTRVAARTAWGRPKVMHCFQPTRAEQSKGAPKLASVLREFKSLSRYTQAELNAAVSHALTTFFIKSNLPTEMMAAMFGQDTAQYMESRREINALARDDLASVTMEDNIIVPLMMGDEIVDPKSNRPNEQFEPFIRSNMRRIFAGLGISYEMGMRDFERTNYSSARAAMLLDWKTFLGELNWLGMQFGQVAYSAWLEEAIDRGEIDGEGFYENRDAFCECRLTGAPRGHVDPIKEAAAATEKLTNGTGTLDRESAEQGSDWQENQDQRAREIKRAFKMAEDMELPEVAAYTLAGLTIPGQFALQSPIDPENGPGAITESEDDQAENAGLAQGGGQQAPVAEAVE